MFLYLIRILLTHFLNSKIVRILYVYLNLEYYKPFIEGQNIALDIIVRLQFMTHYVDLLEYHYIRQHFCVTLIQLDLENSYSSITRINGTFIYCLYKSVA